MIHEHESFSEVFLSGVLATGRLGGSLIHSKKFKKFEVRRRSPADCSSAAVPRSYSPLQSWVLPVAAKAWRSCSFVYSLSIVSFVPEEG